MDNFVSYDCGPKRAPVEIFWDKSEKRFFGVETDYYKTEGQETDVSLSIEQRLKEMSKEFSTFFYSAEVGIKNQDCYKLDI